MELTPHKDLLVLGKGQTVLTCQSLVCSVDAAVYRQDSIWQEC